MTMFPDIRSYLQTISSINDLEITDPQEWLFYPGMLFGSRAKWWADWKIRYTAHEGLDILFYRKLDGTIGNFDPSIKVPAMDDGVVLNICRDFLGQSVVIEHRRWSSITGLELEKSAAPEAPGGEKDSRAIAALNRPTRNRPTEDRSIVAAVYSHITADPELEIGEKVDKGKIIGAVADTSMRKSGIPAHLHVSIVELQAAIEPARLNWELFADPECDCVRFINPLALQQK